MRRRLVTFVSAEWPPRLRRACDCPGATVWSSIPQIMSAEAFDKQHCCKEITWDCSKNSCSKRITRPRRTRVFRALCVPSCSHGALPPDPLLTRSARKGAQLPGWCTKRRGLNACCRASARLRSVVTAE